MTFGQPANTDLDGADDVIEHLCVLEGIFILLLGGVPDSLHDLEGSGLLFLQLLPGVVGLLGFYSDHCQFPVEEAFLFHQPVHLLHEEFPPEAQPNRLALPYLNQLIGKGGSGIYDLLVLPSVVGSQLRNFPLQLTKLQVLGHGRAIDDRFLFPIAGEEHHR